MNPFTDDHLFTLSRLDKAYLGQMLIMADTVVEPARAARVRSEMWDTPLGAAFAGLSKTERVLNITPESISLVGQPAKQAEELREAASYLLRAAQLIDTENRNR